LLLSHVDYKVVETPRGVWRRYMYPNGRVYADFTSNATVLGFPALHYTSGISAETGSIAVSRGFIAVGRRAVGVFAIGRVAVGWSSQGLVDRR
jgi:hypothetical protein